MNEAQRQTFMRRMRGFQTQAESIGVTFTQTTRFEREIYAANILDQLKDANRTVVVMAQQSTDRTPIVGTRPAGEVKRDPMYDLELEFSDDGNGFGNPLVNPVPNEEYYVRCRIRQHQADPLLQGFKLTWYKPEGWAWVDGIGATTVEEAVSNPAIITRVARSPATDRGGKFRVVVIEKYL